MIDQVKLIAPKHPEWKTAEPFASILKDDMEQALSGGKKALMALAAATHANLTTEELDQSVRDWLASARHPKTGHPYNQMVFKRC